MASLHGRNGYLKNIRIFITEHKSIQTEFRRRESLECGMILDLCPHALSVIYEIVPRQLEWKDDDDGNTWRRTDRAFEVVAAIRARDNLSILKNQDSETFASLHLRGWETVDFIPQGAASPVETIERPFDILIVVGKGVSIAERNEKRDLKAIEIEFDGQVVRGNFDTNGLAGVVDQGLQRKLASDIDPTHKGLNLPLQRLALADFDFERAQAGQIVEPFQSYEDAFRIAELLDASRRHPTAADLFHYRKSSSIADLVNRCHGKVLSSKWSLDEDDLARLVFGEAVAAAVA